MLEHSVSIETLHSIYLSLFNRTLTNSNLSQIMKDELSTIFADKFVRVLIGFSTDSMVAKDGEEYSMRQLGQFITSLKLLSPKCARSIEQAVSMVLYQTNRIYFDRIHNR